MDWNEAVKRIAFDECHEWSFEKEIYHKTHRYFSIIGLKNKEKEQVLIRQEEIGVLALLYTNEATSVEFLIQLKAEPGNFPLTQWAPTVQATKSNYERVHEGKETPYLDYFINGGVTDTKSSEQGDKFYNKFNRNITQEVSTKLTPVNENYIWVNLDELKEQLKLDYTVNTDLRSVIASSNWSILSKAIDSIFCNSELESSLASALNRSYFTKRESALKDAIEFLKMIYMQSNYEYNIVPIEELDHYEIKNDGIYSNNLQQVVGYFDVELKSREVQRWQQPLLCSDSIEKSILCIKIDDGIAYVYLKAYHEVGFIDRCEFGPSFQTGKNHSDGNSDDIHRLLQDSKRIASIFQTDEGGRFYHNRHLYELVIVQPTDSSIFPDNNGRWISLGELEYLCHREGTVTNELRTCVSVLLSFA